MNLEVFPNKESLIDGVPASKAGEWPGVKSCKWNGGKRIIDRPNTSDDYYQRRYNEGTGFGRVHFPAKNCEEKGYSPGKKQFYKNQRSNDNDFRKTSIKYINPVHTENKTFYAKRHYLDTLPTVESEQKNCIKTFYPKNYAKTLEEIAIEKEMCPKARIRNLSRMRNGFPVIAPGDKSYKNPEYSNNFFVEGGLIPGSTNVFNYNKTVSRKNYFFYETLDLNVKTLDPKKLWSNKQKQEVMDYDTNYVKMLNIWDKTVGKEIEIPTVSKVDISKNKTGSAAPNKSATARKK